MPKPFDRVTISDVARSANVAVGTVSRVLNNFADVAPDVRQQVLSAAQELGYMRLRRRKAASRPAAAAAAAVGVVCFGMEDTLVHLPIVSTAIQGIEEALAGRGASMVLANIPQGDRVPAFLQSNTVAGLILKGPNQGELPTPDSCELLRQVYRVPHVWLMGRLGNAEGDHCNLDNDEAGRLMVEHLVSRGHRRIAFLNPKPGQTQFEQLKRALLSYARRTEASLEIMETEPTAALRWPLPAITSEANVELLVRKWAAQPASRRATAIVAPSDRPAVQAYSALQRCGIRPGRDVSVISCNNEEPVIMGLEPALTTVDVHAEQIGRCAVDLLRWRIEQTRPASPVQLLVKPDLVVRDSVRSIS
jgi:LacI family transcriptional regulator